MKGELANCDDECIENKSETSEENIGDQVKILKNQLGDQDTASSAMQEFLAKALSEDSGSKFLEAYLKASPDCKELFSFCLDKSAPKKLLFFWRVFERIFSFLSENNTSSADFSSTGHFLVCKILHNHMKVLYASLYPTTAKLRTSVLRCMSAMLTQGIQSVREFMNCFDFGIKQLKEISKVSKKVKDDVRTCFVRFYLGFLVFGDVNVTQKLLDQKDLSTLIMNELHLDKVDNILIVLETLSNKVVGETNLLKKTKLLFFNHSVLSKFIILCKHNDENVKNLSMKLITTLCTNQKHGICFSPKEETYTGRLVNPVLLKFLLSVKLSALHREDILNLTMETLSACPDLIIPYINGLNLSLDPRLVDFWCTKIHFLVKLWESIPNVTCILKIKSIKLENKEVIKLLIPHIVTRQLFTQGMKSKVHKVKEITLELIEKSLLRCMELKVALEERYCNEKCLIDKTEMLQRWIDLMIRELPDITPVIGVRQMSALSVDTSIQNYDAEDKTHDKAVESSYDPLQMDILLDISIKCLNLYQSLRPGILSESGFNIGKLLIFSRTVSEDVVNQSLLILLHESGMRVLLEKKMSGSDNIFHLLLQLLITWKNSEIIVRNAKVLLYKILNVVGQFDEYAFEIEAWIEGFLSAINNADIDLKELVKQFSQACLKTVNEPFMYLENLASIKVDSEHSAVKLPSPLFFIVLRCLKSSFIIQYFTIPVIKELVLCDNSPELFLDILYKEVNEDNMIFYQDVLRYCYHWVDGLSLDTGNIDKIIQTDQLLQPLHLEEESAIMKYIASILLEIKIAKDDLTAERKIDDILNSSERLKLLCSQTSALSGKAVAVFLSNVIRFLYHTIYHISCSKSGDLLELLEYLVRSILVEIKEPQISLDFVLSLFKIPLFCKMEVNDNMEVSDKNSFWQTFSNNVIVMCIECCPLFQTTRIFESFVEHVLAILKLIRTEKNWKKADRVVGLFCQFAVHLNKRLIRSMSEIIVGTVITCTLNEKIDNKYLSIWLKLLDVIKDCVMDDFVLEKLVMNDLIQFFHGSIKYKNELMMKVFLNISSLSNFSEFYIHYEDYENLLKVKSDIFIKCCIFMSRCNTPVVKSEDLKIKIPFNQEFISHVSKIPAKDLCTYLLPLVYNVVEKNLDLNEHSEISSRLKLTIWKDVVKELNSKDNKFAVPFLSLLLPYTKDKEKIKVLKKLTLKIRLKSSKEELENILYFCMVSLSALNDGINEEICLLEAICAVIETIISSQQAHLHELCMNYLSSFIGLMNKFSSHTECNYYENLASIWMKFVKKILKTKYEDELAMETLSKAIKILYRNCKFIKFCTVQSKDLYQFVVNHSKFFEVMFSEDQCFVSKKLILIKLISCLIELSNIFDTHLVPVLLATYNAKSLDKDKFILSILYQFEKNDVSLSSFYPFVWGSNAINVYREQGGRDSVLKERSSAQVLGSLDKQQLVKSAIKFPIHLTLHNSIEIGQDKDVYDPFFLLPLFVSLLQPQCVVDCYHFMESGCLSFAFSSLSSHDIKIRKMGYCIIALYSDHLDGARFREKSQLIYLLMLLKNSVSEEFMRFPCVWCAFLVEYISYITRPDHYLYPVLNNYILQNPVLKLREVPLFSSLFSSSNMEQLTERTWLLSLLANGLKDLSDYYLYKKHHVFELLLSFYDSQICDKNLKLLIHDVFIAACSLDVATFDLVKTNSILVWIYANVTMQWNPYCSAFYNLLFTLTDTFRKNINNESSNKFDEKKQHVIPKLFHHEVALICQYGIQTIDSLKYSDQILVCSVYAWMNIIPNHFSETDIWFENNDQLKYMDVVTNLLVSSRSDDNLNAISDLFCTCVLHIMEQITSTTWLVDKPWKKIYHIAKAKEVKNLLELFDKLEKWSYKSLDKTLLIKIIEAKERFS